MVIKPKIFSLNPNEATKLCYKVLMLHNSYQNYKQQKAIETKLEIEYEQFLIDRQLIQNDPI